MQLGERGGWAGLWGGGGGGLWFVDTGEGCNCSGHVAIWEKRLREEEEVFPPALAQCSEPRLRANNAAAADPPCFFQVKPNRGQV